MRNYRPSWQKIQALAVWEDPANCAIGTKVCESHYQREGIELPHQHGHMTSALSATLAKKAGAEALIPFHL